MLNRLLRKSPPVPRLHIAQRVIDKMQIAANTFVEDETGEAMVGLMIGGREQAALCVLDTISPDASAVRQLHTFQQGDELQDEIMWWWRENWEMERRKSGRGWFGKRREWDVPLRYLGDWHKQPGHMIAPSGGDLQTALEWLDEAPDDAPFLLVPIVTLEHPATIDPAPADVNYVLVDQGDGSALRVDWWYVHRDWGVFQPITPIVVENADLPELAPVAWHLNDQDRSADEWEALEAGDFAITVLLADIDAEPPLEVCVSAARLNGAEQIYLVATPYNYPHAPPQMRLAPFVNLGAGQAIADVFPAWWQTATPAAPAPDFVWTTDKKLVDYIQAVEIHHGIRPAPQAGESTNDTESTAETGQQSIPTEDESS